MADEHRSWRAGWALPALLVVATACDSTDVQVPAAVSISPAALTLTSLGATSRLAAAVSDASGAAIRDPDVTWWSAEPTVATVGDDGLVTAVANGAAPIRATAGSATAWMVVTVAQEVAIITLSPAEVVLNTTGDTATVTAVAVDAGGSAVARPTLVWDSDDPTVATVSQTGLVTAVAPGTTAVLAESGARSGAASARVEHELLAISTTSLPSALAGVAYEETLVATGGDGDYAWSVTEGALASGLTLDAASGVVSGVPDTGGVATFTVRVESGDGQASTADLSIDVDDRLTVTTTDLPAAESGAAYQATLTATGGGGGYAWAVASGALPAGLALSGGGTIAGTAGPPGSATFTVEVGSADGQTASATLTLDVTGPVAFEVDYLEGGYPGVEYADALPAAAGGDGTFSYSVTDGALPPGLALAASTGALGGVPTQPGMFFFEVTATSGGASAAALFSITISNNPPDGFNLWGVNVAAAIPSATARAQIDTALALWEAIVQSDLSDITLGNVGANQCGGFGALLSGAFIDDVVVLIDIAPNDGPGGVLGFAGPCITQQAAPQTIAGRLSLDIDDLDRLTPTAALAVVWHEIGHIMGIGGGWSSLGLVGGPASAPRFLGAQANAEYQALGGTEAQIPVEDGGGAGTARVHWDEGHFDSEIMTGYVDDPSAISRMTIASLADIGWSVSFAAADPYQLPACSPDFSCVRAQGAPGAPRAVEVAPPFEPLVLPVERVHARGRR